jgi:hypothetical protein
MSKGLGKDIKEFYYNYFPQDYYFDEGELDLEDYNGTWLLEDNQKYDLSQIGIFVENEGDRIITFSSAFLKWKKSQTTETLLVEIPKGKKEEATKQIRDLGYKVV